MKQYRISVQVDIFVEAESMEEAHKIWVRDIKMEIGSIEGRDPDWDIADCEIVCI